MNLSAPGPKPGFGSCGRAGDCDAVFSYAMFRDLQKAQTVFTDIAAHVDFGANLAYEAQTSSGEGLLVSGSYFPVLGLTPALGRLLNPPSMEMGGGPVSPNVLQILPSGAVEGPSMRLVADMADVDNTRLTNFMGQSGHPASPNYGDQLDAWVRVQPLPLPMTDEAVARVTRHTLALVP